MKLSLIIEHLQDLIDLDGDLDLVVRGTTGPDGTSLETKDITVRHEKGIAGGRKVVCCDLRPPMSDRKGT